MFAKVIIEHNFHENKTEIVYKAKTFRELWDSYQLYTISDGVSHRFAFVLLFLNFLKITKTFGLYLKWILKRGLRKAYIDEWEYESLIGEVAPKFKKKVSNSPKVGIRYTHYNHKINFITFGTNKRLLDIECSESSKPGITYIFNKYWYYMFKYTGVLPYILEILARIMAFYKRESVYELKGYKR